MIEKTKIRNVSLISHSGAGKTSLTESILFISKAIQKKGSVDKGTTVSDFEPEEIKRHISLSTTILPCNWKGYKINLIDTPGYVEFISEVRGGLIASESSIILVDAVGGVEVGTERVWEFAEEENLPVAFVISRMDRENANFSNALDSIKQFFGQDAVPYMIPIGEGLNFKGYINLITGKAKILENDNLKEIDLPDSEKEKFETYRNELVEKIAEVDEEFLNNYLSNGTLNEDEIKRGLQKGIGNRTIHPVLISSSVLDVGTEEILDFIVNEFPEPKLSEKRNGYDTKTKEVVVTDFDINKPFSGLVFKTIIDPFIGRINFIKVITGKITQDIKIHNVNKEQEERISGIAFISGKNQEKTSEITAGDIGVLVKLNLTTTGDTLAQNNFPVIYNYVDFPYPVVAYAVEPKRKEDEDRLTNALFKMSEEDPTFLVERNDITKQLIIRGMGLTHLQVNLEKISRKYGVEVILTKPEIAYKETVKGSAKAEGKYKKQTGGHGQYGHCFIELNPLERGKEFEFVDKIFGGAIPKNYIPAVEKGIREAMKEGVLAGYPVIDIQVVLYDGSYHPVDSSELAFKIAGSMAFKKAFNEANPILLEPILEVEVRAPEQFLGDIISDLNTRRAKILGMDSAKGISIVRALVPEQEMLTYGLDLASITQGRGYFTAKFAKYEEVPQRLAEDIIKKRKQESERS
ncbi:MAG TPA: elongation factor G [Caldisericia bacterium]|nr:elongation factor G [Caldisericia bacterium]HPB33484.1 elongation factor G [Caldisericia bacterium]HQL67160.1 elongation factor G [Caldisericia bacterium]HQN48233.1 elongation factor G [Caldisericia bacterium]HQO99524.1 elongation factor G [Caldisericia bacterium]